MPFSTLTAVAILIAISRTSLSPDVASLVDAERAFARASAEKGTRAAFLVYLADDGVLFRPDPVKGKSWYRSQAASTATLVWEPEFADVSASNDLGYTAGPWAYRPDSTVQASSFGHYVSVWRRGADREWEVAIDAAVAHARVARPQSIVTATRYPPADEITQQEALAAVQQEERDFVEAVSRGVEDAFDTFASDDVVVLRDGDLPAHGRDKMRVLLAKRSGTYRMQPISAEASRAGDLGFTIGRCEVTYHDKTSTSYTLRIWKRMPDGAWKIVLDLDSPAAN
jgi:ketosteroid isomerase-like protein